MDVSGTAYHHIDAHTHRRASDCMHEASLTSNCSSRTGYYKHYFAKNGMAIFLPIEPRLLTSSDSRSVAASVILWGPSDVLASFQKPSSKSVEIYRAIISHLLDLIATTAQSDDLLIFGGNGNATLDSILVRPFLSERKPPTTKAHQTWAPCVTSR